MENECKVCRQLIKEKHQKDILWKIFCIVFATLALIFGILYFSNGTIKKETKIEINGSFNNNSSTNNNIIVGSDDNNIESNFYGTVIEEDYTPIICIVIIAGISILTVGGVLIAYYVKRNDTY